MTTDYRAELQLLFDAAESFTEPALGHHRPWAAALDRARALLAQPVADGPTDDELLAMRSWSSHGQTFDSDLVDYARAVLARWGHPANALPTPEATNG